MNQFAGGGRTVVDLFCGAGGLSHGFSQAGFRVVAGADHNAAAGRSFSASHPEAKFLGGKIQDLVVADILKTTGLKAGALDVLVGGPPCQGYSVFNHQRGTHDPRAGLFKEYLRIVAGLLPRWLVMENVPGLISVADGGIIREIQEGMGALGYRVEWKILKAEEYGVPQERRRIVFMANRVGAPILHPKPTHGEGLRPFVTIWDAIGDLPPLANGEAWIGAGYGAPPSTAYQSEMREGCVVLKNHSAARLSPVNIARMKHIPVGGSWRDIPIEMLPQGLKTAKRYDHTKRYGRPRKDDLSSTILTKCDIHWGAFIHPEQERSISIREAARLQSFPDSFEFVGTKTEQSIQIGNAVPPLLGRAVAEAILRCDEAIQPRTLTQIAA